MMRTMAVMAAILMASQFSTIASANGADGPPPVNHIVYTEQTGRPLSLSSAIQVKGQILVPISQLAELLHASVSWDARHNTAVLRRGAQTVKLTARQKTALFSGYPRIGRFPLSALVIIRQGHLYAPVRSLAGLLGYRVLWAQGAVSIQTPISPKQQQELRSGELTAARKLAMSLLVMPENILYSAVPLPTTDEREGFSLAYIFPFGKADRFFTVDSGVVSYYELKDGYLAMTWQAHLPVGQKSDIEQFAGHQFTDASGDFPAPGRPFFYYRKGSLVTANIQECGSISAEGKVTRIGYRVQLEGEKADLEGQIVYELQEELQPR